MTAGGFMHRNGRPVRPVAATHLFMVWQAVRLKGSFGGQKTAEIYHIISTLPPMGGSPQCRIRNDDERYERVTTQDSLEPVTPQPGSGETLMERTFGHAQGAKTQQPRDQKAEAGKGAAQT